MSSARLIILGSIILFQSSFLLGAEGRFQGGDGHLAVQVKNTADWNVVYPADSIASKASLRTSPAGVVRIDLPSATLYLAADSDVELDIDARQIVLHHGRLRLTVEDAAKTSWQASTSSEAITCLAGAEMVISVGRERAAIHLLRGTVRRSLDQKNLKTYTAPDADLAGNGERVDLTRLEGGVEEWIRKTRSTTEPRSTLGLGQLLAKDAQSGNQVRLEVARYHANVVLQAPVALVQIDQSFFNPYSSQQEGTFVFNLPPGASVSRFAMYVTHDSLIEGELIERKRADEIYTSIVRTRRDPAILEQIGDNLFRMRIFPIPGNDTKRILLDYTVPLVSDYGQYRFDLPLMSDLKPIWDFSLSGIIHPPLTTASVVSLSHPNLRFTTLKNGTVTFHENGKYVKPPAHFTVRYQVPQEPEPSVRSYQSPGEQNQHFVVTVPAAMNPIVKQQIQPMDVLVLVDTSGNSRNLSQLRLAARTIIGGLRANDRLQIGCSDVSYRPLTDGWCLARSPEANAGIQKLYDQFPLGISDLDSTFQKALSIFKDSADDRRRVVVYLGDGPSQNIPRLESFEPVAADQPKVSLFAIRPGQSSAGRDWLLRETVKTNGRLIELSDSSQPIRDLFAWSLSGLSPAARVNSVDIDGVDTSELYYSSFWPAGHDLLLYGRVPPEDALSITIKVEQKSRKFTVDAKSNRSADNIFTGRLWARQKLQAMLDGAAEAAQIVTLCQEWSLMSPLTAFLVLETEQDYVRWQIPRLLRRRYWLPVGSEMATPNRPAKLPAVTPTTPSAATATSERLARRNMRVIDAAERLLKQDQPEQALQLLRSLNRRSGGSEFARYNDLLKQAHEKLRPAETLPLLKLWRPLVDRRVNELFPYSTPQMLLQFGHGSMSSEFLEHHPHAKALLRTVTECPESMTLVQFAEFIQKQTDVHVIMDHHAIIEEGTDPREVIVNLEGLAGICVRSMLREALEPLGFICVPERHLLRITMPHVAKEQTHTIVYPVEDLVRSTTMPPPHSLANPYLDLEESSRRRLETRLKTVVSVRFQQLALTDALAILSDQIGTPVIIDRPTLREEGVEPTAIVNLELPDVPAEVALKEILHPLGLTTMIHNERIKVTSQAEAHHRREIRLYCTAGLESQEPRPRFLSYGGDPWNPSWGMGGTGMGGMGGGMGGFGGAMGGSMVGGVALGGAVSPPLFDEDQLPVEPFNVAPSDGSSRSRLLPSEAETDDEQIRNALLQNPGQPASQFRQIMNVIQDGSHGKWMDNDGEGGSQMSYPLARTLVIEQSQEVHRETAEIMATLRRQLANSVVWRSPVKPLPDQIPDFRTLMNVIQETIPARWMDFDQGGGSISPFPQTESLIIQQNARAHEEISILLTKLRRARYIAESLPYRTSLEGIDDSSFLDRQSFTELPRNGASPSSIATADEIKLLASRRVPATMNQRWRSVSTAAHTTREFTIRTSGPRLQLNLADRILRADGPRAAVAYPGLALVEIDDWGDSVRQLADVALPWLPHRSNEELAELFDVVLIAEDSKVSTLRFNFPKVADTYLQATFSKLTRQPIKWLVVAGNQPQFELQIDMKSVVAIDPNGQELERWELIGEEASQPIPTVNEGWGNLQIVDLTAVATFYTRARDFERKGAYKQAILELQQALQEQPYQPLLNFLLAWSCEFWDTPDGARVRMASEALKRVAISDASDLVRMITPNTFRSVDIERLLRSVPEEQRSGEVWAMLAEFEQNAGKYQSAIADLNRALKFPADADIVQQRQLQRIELLLALDQIQDAEVAVKDLKYLTDSGCGRLMELFARAGRHEIADGMVETLLRRSPATGAIRGQLYSQFAWYYPKGRRRWELLLQAAIHSPSSSRVRERLVLQILDEAESDKDANVLGELATTVQDAKVSTDLRSRQAELSLDPKLAGKIVLDLFQAGQVVPHRFLWALQVLNAAERHQDVVRLVEARLRAGQVQELRVKLLLREAYRTLGREADAQRASTDAFNAPPPPDPPPISTPINGRQTGGGFF